MRREVELTLEKESDLIITTIGTLEALLPLVGKTKAILEALIAEYSLKAA